MTPPTDSQLTLASPLSGTIVPLADVPDPMFASKKLGDGFAVEPSADAIVAPVSGTVLMVA